MTDSLPGAAPSDEYILHCDMPGCQAQLSMVAGVSRSEHGWGRCTIHKPLSSDWAFGEDYDLCAEHYKVLTMVLQGRLNRFGDDDLWWEKPSPW